MVAEAKLSMVVTVRACDLIWGIRPEDDPAHTTAMVMPGTRGRLLDIGDDGYVVRWDRAMILDPYWIGNHELSDDQVVVTTIGADDGMVSGDIEFVGACTEPDDEDPRERLRSTLRALDDAFDDEAHPDDRDLEDDRDLDDAMDADGGEAAEIMDELAETVEAFSETFCEAVERLKAALAPERATEPVARPHPDRPESADGVVPEGWHEELIGTIYAPDGTGASYDRSKDAWFLFGPQVYTPRPSYSLTRAEAIARIKAALAGQ